MPLLIETPRLIARNFAPDEEDAYVDLFADPEVNKHLASRTDDENRRIFRDTMIADEAGAPFTKCALISKAGNTFIGMGLLRLFNDEAGQIEVGYALHKNYWGQGLATEITRALVEYAAKQPGVTSIVAVTTPANIASQSVLEKAGLINQGSIVRDNVELTFFKKQVA